jgi:hypothetical protein
MGIHKIDVGICTKRGVCVCMRAEIEVSRTRCMGGAVMRNDSAEGGMGGVCR